MISYSIEDGDVVLIKMSEYIPIEELLEWFNEFTQDEALPNPLRMLVDTYKLNTRYNFDEITRVAASLTKVVPLLKRDCRVGVVSSSERVRTAVDICGKLMGVLPISYKLKAFSGTEEAENWLNG